MADVIAIGANRWVPIDDPPEIPEQLPQIAATNPAAPLRWYARPDEWGDLYAAVGGDCGAEGPYVVGVYFLVFDDTGPDPLDPGPRYPTFDEIADLTSTACLPGVVLALSFVGGAAMVEPPEGRAVMLAQTMVIDGTPAASRWNIANPGTIVRGTG